MFFYYLFIFFNVDMNINYIFLLFILYKDFVQFFMIYKGIIIFLKMFVFVFLNIKILVKI